MLGVNIGTLGYLTQVEPDDLETALAAFLAGTHQVEERMTLEVTRDRSRRRDTSPGARALNEATRREDRARSHRAGRRRRSTTDPS